MDRNVVSLPEDLVERDALDLHRLGAAGREVGVVGEHPHPEGLSALGDLAADAAESDDAEGLAEELDAGERLAVPLPGAH
jgi:hypothetical protein